LAANVEMLSRMEEEIKESSSLDSHTVQQVQEKSRLR